MKRADYRDNYRSASQPRSTGQLQDDLVVAFDEIGALKTKVWVLSGALTCCGAVIGWLSTQLLSCLGTAHMAASQLVQR